MLRNVQRLNLNQKLSPLTIQTQQLLAIPSVELEDEIKSQVEQNPLLEEQSVPADSSGDNTDFSGGVEKLIGDFNQQDEELNLYNGRSSSPGFRENIYGKFYDKPLDQLYSLGLNEKDELIGVEIIGSLDDDGYLRVPVEELLEDLNSKYSLGADNEDIERVLKVINKMEPLGLGARNLQECLLIQLEEMEIEQELKKLCSRMIKDYFEDFTHRHYEKLVKELNVSKDKLNEMFDAVHKLNPHPGLNEAVPESDFIYPDFIVSKVDDRWNAELTRDFSKRVRISPKYLEMFNSKDTPDETREFIRNKLEAARWFINAIRSRKETMLKVMKSILDKQPEFFESNGEILKPMFEKDIAEDIGMDISTVSRVVRGKYVQTDFGIFELKHFFSAAFRTDAGEDISNKLVKEKIRDIIENEDKSKPFSDDMISELMKDLGYNIARRTVSKYRESMRIPKATLRRRMAL